MATLSEALAIAREGLEVAARIGPRWPHHGQPQWPGLAIRLWDEGETRALEPFLRRLAEVFPDAEYERAGARELRVRYRRCGCDLVTSGWVRTPLLCECSAHNLRENFTAALGSGVEVELVESILGGAERCELVVRLPGQTGLALGNQRQTGPVLVLETIGAYSHLAASLGIGG